MANDLKLIEISAFIKIFNSSKKTIILFTLISSLIGILIFGFQNPKYGSKSIIEIGYHRAEGNTPHTIEPVLAKIEISLYKFLKNKSIIIRPHKLSAWPSLNQNYISLEAYSNSNQKNINTIMEAQSYLIKEHNQKLKKTRKKHEDLDNIKRQAYLNEVSVLKNKIEIYINSIENYKSKLEETLDRKLIESELKSNDLLILESNLLTKITENSLELENLKIELNKLETENAIFNREAIKKRYFQTNVFSEIESFKTKIDLNFILLFSIVGFIASLFYILIIKFNPK